MTNKVKIPLRLVDGKFMRGDVEEAPEIGNLEQIEVLKRLEWEALRREEEAKAGLLDVYIYIEDIEYNTVCELTCICGNEIENRNTNYTDDWEELKRPFYEGSIITCKKCGRKYKVNGIYAKLIL